MNQPHEKGLDERVLVLAPTAGDAALSRTFLTEAGFACHVCLDLCALGREFEQGAGALLFTEEVLADSDSHRLVEALRSQPNWSDVPILLLTSEGADSPAAVWAMEMLGNVTLLERPVRVTLLVSALRTALKARHRQYELRNYVEALRDSEEQFRTLVNNSPELIARLDSDLRHTFVSPAIERLFGLRAEELLGKTVLEVGLPEDIGRKFGEKCRDAGQTGQPVTFDFTDDRTGSLKYLVSKIVPEPGPGGIVNSFLVMTTDITERTQIEQSLRDSEERYRATVEHAAVGVCNCTPDGRFIYANRTYCEIVGYRLDELLQMTWQELTLPDDREADLALGQRVRAGEIRSFTLEKRYVRKDGSFVWVSLFGSFVRDADGRVRLGVGVIVDISDRKQAEDEARKNQAIFKLVHSIGQIGHWEWNSLTDENKWSPEIEALYGLPPGGFEGTYQAWTKLVHPDDLAQAEEDVRLALETGKYFTEFRVIWPDGSVHWLEARANVFKDGQNAPARIVGVKMDVTERKRAEEKLMESEARFRQMAEAMPQIVYVNGPDGRTEYVNSQWRDYTGMTIADDYTERNVVHPDDYGNLKERWLAAMATGTPLTAEFRLRRVSDGKYRCFLTRAMPARDDEGQVVRWYGTSTDIEDLKRIEQALSEADRRKDEFLATLAHELRNPLAPIRNGLQLMRMASGDRYAVEQARAMMDRQLTQLVRLVDDLMDVSRISRGRIELRREHVQLAPVVNSAVETSRPLIEEMGHELTVALPKSPVVVDVDLTRLAQVFLNLLNNAANYTERGGQIWLTAEREGSDMVVSVKDTGIGIAADELPRLFTMFSQSDQSLERSQGGLGIGLALVKRLAEMHGGTIEARSEGPGKGSEFVVRLPLVVEASKPQSSSREERALVQSSRRILVVDDNRDGADRQRTHEAGFDYHMVKPVDADALLKLLAGLRVAKE